MRQLLFFAPLTSMRKQGYNRIKICKKIGSKENEQTIEFRG
ncbi:hypothetical protein BLAHAN_05689 [Blautia hansenii DSM 20583]|uniref:Uncharacterized protein n=1 Tax=Blautia hansenii DSM 20583 TaxID=537007 RepID=C9L8G7_BLAHA|nr:hypothetical protein BLAHAN_05689 [Blautia hansenii DSM 20583]